MQAEFLEINNLVIAEIAIAKKEKRISALMDAYKQRSNLKNQLKELNKKIELAKTGDFSKLVTEYEYDLESE
jgi:hypothetical protein